ncbi:hypothetical protein PANDA_015848 [Ailuropoda melanoleuca]|uniref:Uncharacterized protein n=1 Tax=Ailuropoda melanoleuca TaxID=9646 RepID=D2HUB4_AILME|nr:hypothetical protein PANDA_015848 [Ailuropoda melanoleuca]
MKNYAEILDKEAICSQVRSALNQYITGGLVLRRHNHKDHADGQIPWRVAETCYGHLMRFRDHITVTLVQADKRGHAKTQCLGEIDKVSLCQYPIDKMEIRQSGEGGGECLISSQRNIEEKDLLRFQSMKTNPTLSNVYIWANKFDEATCVAYPDSIQMGCLKPGNTDVEPFVAYLAEVSDGYWTPT